MKVEGTEENMEGIEDVKERKRIKWEEERI